MPELPEVECVRRSLVPHVQGRRVVKVTVHRPQVVTGDRSPRALLVGQTISALDRHGKNLLILGSTSAGRCLCVHLGMSGAVRVFTPGDRTPAEPHTHVVWRFDSGARMAFIDPRRFGGVWTHDNLADLRQARLGHLGPDALLAKPADIWPAFQRTRRPLKAVLLDQGVMAGLGNIYADELLFRCGIDPRTRADALQADELHDLLAKAQHLLAEAVAAGASTLNDASYYNATGAAGSFQLQHFVYGRGGDMCKVCGKTLSSFLAAGRTTVCCPQCQRRLRLRRAGRLG